MRHIPRTLLTSALLAPVLALTACGTSEPSRPITLSLSGTSAALDGGQSVLFMASVQDVKGRGASFTLSGPGTLSYPPSTILSSPEFQVYYAAPTSIAAKTSATLTATAINDGSKTASAAITIYPTVVLVKFSPQPQPQVGVAYTYNLAQGASGGAGQFSFTASDPLPPGLTLSLAGVVSGTPTATGTYKVHIQVQDTTPNVNGGAASQDYTFTVS